MALSRVCFGIVPGDHDPPLALAAQKIVT